MHQLMCVCVSFRAPNVKRHAHSKYARSGTQVSIQRKMQKKVRDKLQRDMYIVSESGKSLSFEWSPSIECVCACHVVSRHFQTYHLLNRSFRDGEINELKLDINLNKCVGRALVRPNFMQNELIPLPLRRSIPSN